MAKYGKKSQRVVKMAVSKYKRGTLKSGRSGKVVKSREQAIAIGLSEARQKGIKVPKKKKTSASKRPSSSSHVSSKRSKLKKGLKRKSN